MVINLVDDLKKGIAQFTILNRKFDVKEQIIGNCEFERHS